MKTLSFILFSGLILLTITACGGGGGSGKTPYTETNPPSADTTPPYISSCSASSDRTISMIYSEAVTKASAQKIASYTIQGGSSVPAVIKAVIGSDNRTVTLTLGNSMEHGIPYTVNASSISDTSGNVLASGSAKFSGRGPVSAVLSDLPNAVTNSRSASISVSGTDITRYQYSVNGSEWREETRISTAISLSNLSEGNVTIQVVGKDSLGNWQPFATPTEYSWTVDTSAPVAVLHDLPASITNSDAAAIHVSGTQVSAYKYRIGDDGWSDVIDTNNKILLTDLDDGTISLNVIGRDPAGNWQSESSPSAYSWKIDTSIPAVTISGIPASATTDTRIAAIASGDNVTSFKYRIDGGAWSSEAATGESNPVIARNLYEGTHKIEAIGKNQAGTWQSESLPSTYIWTIDLTAPSIRFETTPSAYSSDRTPSFKVSGDRDLAYFKYKLDSGEWSGRESSSSPVSIPVTEGSHTIRIIGIDSAGNEQSSSSAAVYSWTADFTAPTARLASLPPSVTNITSGSISVYGTGVSGYKYSMDGHEWSGETDAGTAITLSSLSEGVHSIKAIGCDTAGNWQEIADADTYSWTVDTTPPSAGATNLPANPTGTGSAEITVTGNGVTSYLYSLDGGNWISRDIRNALVLTALREGSHTLSIKGKDDAGNVQNNSFTYSWSVDMTAPAAVLEGTPSAKNNLTSVYISVTGTDVAAYKYSIDGSSFSSEVAVSTPVTITSIGAGPHELSVLGRDSAGNWQSINSPTRFAWQSDFTAPLAAISPRPDALTNATSFEINVTGDDLATYTYSLDNGSSSGAVDQGSPITLRSIREGSHTLRVFATDSYGNTQGSPTTYSWTVDTTPPSAVAMRESGSTSESVSLSFSFTVPSGADKADVQVSTDPAFTDVLFQSGIFSASEGTAQFPYTATETNGNTYYARVRLGDTAGNWSQYGTPSGKVTLTGGLSGEIRNSDGATLSGASVTLRSSANVSLSTTTTGSDGKFVISGIPSGVSDYSATISMSGYHDGTKSNIAIHTGTVSDNGMILLVSTSALPGTITGKVVDANNGDRISGVNVDIYDYRGRIVDTQQTLTGIFTTASLSPGTYSAVCSKNNFFQMRVDNITVNGPANIGTQALCELLTGNHVRVVLIWGAQPKDLDLHVVGPSDNNVSYDGDPGNRFHVYYSNKSFDAAVGKYSFESGFNSYTSALVQDSTGGYGVEAINSWNLMANGVYTFTVHNWSQKNWYLSSPVIRIYDNQGLLQEIPLPTGAVSEWYWKAFQLNIQGNTREQRSITIANQFGTLNYENKAAMEWQTESGGVTAFLLSVARGEHPVVIVMLLLMASVFIALFIWNRKRQRSGGSNAM